MAAQSQGCVLEEIGVGPRDPAFPSLCLLQLVVVVPKRHRRTPPRPATWSACRTVVDIHGFKYCINGFPSFVGTAPRRFS